jgi:hypothetical protein
MPEPRSISSAAPTPVQPRPDLERSSFERQFPARDYLTKYYSEVGAENEAFMHSILDYLADTRPRTANVIEVAGGPSLFGMMALAAHRRRPFLRVTFTDIGEPNLAEVAEWLDGGPNRFDYSELGQWMQATTGVAPDELAQTLRSSRWELVPFDWRYDPPDAWRSAYDLVACHFFAESSTANETEFVEMLARAAELGRPDATVLMSFITQSSGWRVGGRDYPSFPVDAGNIGGYLERAGIRLEHTAMQTVAADRPDTDPGYDGLMFVAGRLPA